MFAEHVWSMTSNQEFVLARHSKESSLPALPPASGWFAAASQYCVPPLGALGWFAAAGQYCVLPLGALKAATGSRKEVDLVSGKEAHV